jgi:hypothetical protein
MCRRAVERMQINDSLLRGESAAVLSEKMISRVDVRTMNGRSLASWSILPRCACLQ